MIYDYCGDTKRFSQGLPAECKWGLLQFIDSLDEFSMPMPCSSNHSYSVLLNPFFHSFSTIIIQNWRFFYISMVTISCLLFVSFHSNSCTFSQHYWIRLKFRFSLWKLLLTNFTWQFNVTSPCDANPKGLAEELTPPVPKALFRHTVQPWRGPNTALQPRSQGFAVDLIKVCTHRDLHFPPKSSLLPWSALSWVCQRGFKQNCIYTCTFKPSAKKTKHDLQRFRSHKIERPVLRCVNTWKEIISGGQNTLFIKLDSSFLLHIWPQR